MREDLQGKWLDKRSGKTIIVDDMIMDGEVDNLPEQSFLNVGTIDDAIEKGNKLLSEAQA